MGHPLLREVARPVGLDELRSDRIKRLVDDMIDTLHDYGGIGLAAPQIAEPIRLAIIEMEAGPSRYGALTDLPLSVYVNPEVEVIDPARAGYWEGCLSIPGLRGFVERPQHIRVRYVDLDGTAHEAQFDGFLATVFQHEFDHLDGVLYVDRIADSRLLSFEAEYARYLMPRDEQEMGATENE